jgi:hypothetical protein
MPSHNNFQIGIWSTFGLPDFAFVDQKFLDVPRLKTLGRGVSCSFPKWGYMMSPKNRFYDIL